jgi:hypothetical protein
VIAGIVETVVSVRVGFGVTAANAGGAVKASVAALSSMAIRRRGDLVGPRPGFVDSATRLRIAGVSGWDR